MVQCNSQVHWVWFMSDSLVIQKQLQGIVSSGIMQVVNTGNLAGVAIS